MKDSIVFLGTGIMGAHMVRNLLKAKFPVTVWNRSIAKAKVLAQDGAIVSTNIADEIKSAKFVILMLSDAKVCNEILEKHVYANLNNGATVIIMATTDIKSSLAQAKECQERNCSYLDAPVSGGEKGAKEGTLAIMVGGKEEDFNNAKDIFAVMGNAVLVGDVSCGQLAKITNQVIVALTIVAMSESLLIAEKGGANLHKLREALMGGFADSPILRQHALRMINKDFKPGGPAKHQLKDLNVAKEVSQELELTLPMLDNAQELFVKFINEGGADMDHSGIIEQIRKLQT